MFWRTVVRASGDSKFLTDGPWGGMVAMMDGTFRMLAGGASWSGHESNHLFLGRAGEDFVRVTGISGLDDPGDSMAAAMLDFDRDGWTDVALANVSKPRFRLLQNRVGFRQRGGANFVALRFAGGNRTAQPRKGWSARNAIGARVELELDDGRRLVREHKCNDGFKAQHTRTMLLGIGAAERVTRLHVRWPSGRRQRIENVTAGELVTLFEDVNQSPTGTADRRERYVRSAATDLRLAGAHGRRGVTVYTTMSTGCAACARSLSDVRALRDAFEPSELTLVGVPVDDGDSRPMLEAYVAAKQPAYSLQLGLAEATTARVRDVVAERLHGSGTATPATIVTDTDGRILAARWGVPTVSELKRLAATQR